MMLIRIFNIDILPSNKSTFVGLFLCCSLFCYSHSIKNAEKDSILKKENKQKHFEGFDEKPSVSFLEKLESEFGKDHRAIELNPDNKSEPEFTPYNLRTIFKLPETVTEQRSVAVEVFDIIAKKKLWIDDFTNEDIVDLPVGIKYEVGNVEYAVGFINAEINPEYTTITAFARVTIQQTDADGLPVQLFFGSDNIKLSHQGGIIGDADLFLLGDYHLPFNGGNWLLSFKGSFDYKTAKSKKFSYVSIGCNGINSLSVNGSVEFSRNMILPVESDGEVNEGRITTTLEVQTYEGVSEINVPNRVRGDFQVVIDDWNDILVEVSLQPFVRAKKRNGSNYEGNLQFHLKKAVLDFSDLRNVTGIRFPDFYRLEGLLTPDSNTWKGIYIEEMEVYLPKEFKTRSSILNNERVGFGAQNIILDSYGISGLIYADNLFSLSEGRTGSINAWAYSIDRIQIELVAGQLIGGGLKGHILLPVSEAPENEDAVGLFYEGLISEDEYVVKVSNDSVINFNLWSAKAQIDPNSSIEFKVKESEFHLKANLNGKMAITADQQNSLTAINEEASKITKDKKKSTISFNGIQFQQLVLQTENPEISVAYMGYKDEMSFANFPVSLSNVELSTKGNKASLFFHLKFNLMDGAGFAAETTLGILAENVASDGLQQWKYSGLDFKDINIAADVGGFKFDGTLYLMQDDKVYGDGFAADLNVKFKSLGDVTIKSTGIFGRTDDFRYWYFDAMIDDLMPPSTVALISPKGFGGGAYYKMKRKGFDASFSPGFNTEGKLKGTARISYEPDSKQGLGVKAMILFNVGTEKALSGGAGFEVLFNSRGGISRAGLYGQAEFMAEMPFGGSIENLMNEVRNHTGSVEDFMGETVDYLANENTLTRPFLEKAELNFPPVPEKVGVQATLGIEYDFENSTLHGALDVFVNVAGGIVQGRSSRGRAGWGELYFAPDQWYVHLGTPEDRLGLKMGIGSFKIESGGYFMIGDKIPASPPPPPIVGEILGTDIQELDYMRDENALGEGKGFAFGSDFSLDTGDLNFLIFYSRFQAGGGFDIMLKDYGQTVCSDSNTEQVGINGWYANGQAYAYLQGELGVNIKLFFLRKKIPILKGGSAVLLQAKAPNPIWMRGYLGGNYNLLGGLIKGNFRFKITIGDECELLETSPLGGLKIIADVSPGDGKEEVDVFTSPQATFNMKVNEPIVIAEENGDKTYKVVLEKFQLWHNGTEIPGELKWGILKDRATFISSDILPPDQSLQLVVEVSFQEQKNGIFETVMVDGQKALETVVQNFVTGKAPTVIPMHNIQYAYPMPDQKYFYKNEYDRGYIQLQRGQDYLFDLSQWTTEVFITDQSGKVLTAKFNYDEAANRVNYKFPDMENAAKYRISIISKTNSTGPHNGEVNEYQLTSLDGDNSVEIRQNNAVLEVREGELERLAYEFSTSRYNSFKQKLGSISTTNRNWGKIYSDVIFLANKIQSEEAFDIAELNGNEYNENRPLVQAEAILTDDYFLKDMKPPLYGQYPLGNSYSITNRDVLDYGVPPVRSVPVNSYYMTSVEYDVNQNWLLSNFPYYYNLPLIYKQDWVDLHSQILNDWIDGLLSSDDTAFNFLDKEYRFMRYGVYTVHLKYMLPGGIKGTNEEYDFKNENRFR